MSNQHNNTDSPSKKNGLAMSKALPVYSDFSHMSAKGGLGDISFVVGLREENAAEIMKRVFPLTKIIPVVKAEKKKVSKKKEKVEEKVCARPDCIARKQRFSELQNENKGLRHKLKNLEGRIETTRNKISLTEKSVIMAEEKNDSLNGQIEDAQTRIFSIQADVEKGESINEGLRKQLADLYKEIEDIKKQTDHQNNQLRDILDNKEEQKLVFSKDKKFRNPQLAAEVSVLTFPTNANDDDSD
eukprot:gene6713-9206_t